LAIRRVLVTLKIDKRELELEAGSRRGRIDMGLATGSLGVYTSRARLLISVDALAQAEELGFSAAWVADTRGEFDVLDRALAITTTLVVGPAVLSVWDVDAAEAARRWAHLDRIAPGRVLMGIGISHAPLVERAGRTYERPMATMEAYLGALDRAEPEVPASRRLLGANGPRMLELAAHRAAGALTYLVTPARTAVHREQLGREAVLAPELKIVLAADRREFRERARAHLAVYLTLPNYCRNLLRMGFSESDLADSGSDRLVEALVAGPDLDAVVTRVAEHRDGGADHVALHVISADACAPVSDWRALSAALLPDGSFGLER
jgi:probable F420-dependent oxidoreductase